MRFTLLFVLAIISLGFIFWKDINHTMDNLKPSKSEKTEKIKSGKKKIAEHSPGISIVEKWDLPAILKEVSGIAYMDDERIACVQDEEGKIFIYNRSSNKIEKEIPFAGPGDYEGITLNGTLAYVLRADGRIYEMNMNSDQSSVKEYKTHLTADHNVEGLCFDKKNDRLLLAIKDDEPGKKDYKGIYAFDLKSKKMPTNPVFKIELNNSLLAEKEGKKSKSIKPSEIGIHPLTNDIYIVDGPNAKLVLMDASGNLKELFQLGKDFSQPEGITFSPQGDIFISNEGTSQPGNIIQVKLNR